MRYCIFISLVFALLCHNLFGQVHPDLYWRFGSAGLGLNFDAVSLQPVVYNNSYTPFTNEGCGVACDRSSGELLFYTDGVNIIDKNDNPMPNGTGLPGNISCFGSGKIFPKPNSCDQYYVFSLNADFSFTTLGTLSYSVVDMTLPGNGTIEAPLGDVTAEGTTSVTNGLQEALAVVPASDGQNGWLIVAPAFSSQVRVYSITSSGINLANTFNLGYNLSDVRSIQLNPQSSRGVIASLIENNETLVFDFNPTNGTLSNIQPIPGMPLGNNSGWYGIFDTEWSSSGDLLYMSKYRDYSPAGGGTLLQYNLNTPTQEPQEIHHISNTSSHLGRGLRRGPDDKIYWIHINPTLNNSQYLAVVHSPNSIGTSCDFEAIGIDMGATLGGTHLFPSFIPYPEIVVNSISLDYNTTVNCDGDIELNIGQILEDNQILSSSVLSMEINNIEYAYNQDIFTWPVDPNTNNPIVVELEIAASNCSPPANVSLFVHHNSISSNSTELFAQDSLICVSSGITLEAANTMLNYTWSTGSNANTIIAQNSGWYTLTATDFNNCVSSDSIYVQISNLINPELTEILVETCENSYTFAAPETVSSITWSTNNSNSTNTFFTSGIYEGLLNFDDGCSQNIQLTLNLLEIPSIVTSQEPTVLLCPQTAQTLSVSSNAQVTWNTGSTSTAISASEPGVYTIVSSNLCGVDSASFNLVSVEPITFSLGENISSCNTVDTLITIPDLPNYLWSDGSTNDNIHITAAGQYWLSSQNICGIVTDSMTVEIFTENPPIGMEAWAACDGSNISIAVPTQLFSSFLWSDGSTGNSYSASHPQLIELQASNGCGTTTYQWNVNPLDCLETIYIPSSFTPNGDGINDVWYPVNGNNHIHSIQIFNRWGELIFQGDENSKIWIGNDLQGQYYVPDGTYTYTIKITQNTIETREIKGHIVLIR